MESKFIENRRKCLEEFVKKIAPLKHIYYASEF